MLCISTTRFIQHLTDRGVTANLAPIGFGMPTNIRIFKVTRQLRINQHSSGRVRGNALNLNGVSCNAYQLGNSDSYGIKNVDAVNLCTTLRIEPPKPGDYTEQQVGELVL